MYMLLHTTEASSHRSVCTVSHQKRQSRSWVKRGGKIGPKIIDSLNYSTCTLAPHLFNSEFTLNTNLYTIFLRQTAPWVNPSGHHMFCSNGKLIGQEYGVVDDPG